MKARDEVVFVGACVVITLALFADIAARPPDWRSLQQGGDKLLCSFQGEAYAAIGGVVWRTPDVDDECTALKRKPEEAVG